jgi:DNA-binding PadR family transcriptional regulator
VRNALLLLLAEEPRNGYQLMQEIEQRSDGRWRPSPGSVYPALSQLEDEGLIRNVQAETGRAFEITDAGRAQAESLGGQAPPWQGEDDPSARSTHALRHLIMSSGMAAWQVAKDGDEQQIAAACDVLAQVRRTLYGILAGEPAPEPKPESDDVAGSEDASTT